MLKIIILSLGAMMFEQPPTLQQQSSIADSSAVRIISALRAQGRNPDLSWITRILRQNDKTHSAAKLNEIADSLTLDIIRKSKIRSASGQDNDYFAALTSLQLSGKTRTGNGVPFVGALQRLIRIHREAEPTSMIRSILLGELLCTSEFRQALDETRKIAISRDWTAPFAMEELIAAATNGGSCRLPSSEQGSVKDALRTVFIDSLASGQAAAFLNAYAGRVGWKR